MHAQLVEDKLTSRGSASRLANLADGEGVVPSGAGEDPEQPDEVVVHDAEGGNNEGHEDGAER